jgi:hypothetical protein
VLHRLRTGRLRSSLAQSLLLDQRSARYYHCNISLAATGLARVTTSAYGFAEGWVGLFIYESHRELNDTYTGVARLFAPTGSGVLSLFQFNAPPVGYGPTQVECCCGAIERATLMREQGTAL